MIFVEYRIILPLSIDLYRIGSLYTTMEMSKAYTSENEGVEILENVPCDQANPPRRKPRNVHLVHRTLKRYHIPKHSSKHSSQFGFEPQQDCVVREDSFDGFPHSKTVLRFESGMEGEVVIDTICCTELKDNMFRLPPSILSQISMVDINLLPDPSMVADPTMVVYKLVTLKDSGMDHFEDLFTKFHRQLLDSKDEWKDFTLEDIRTREKETKDLLDIKRSQRS